MSPAPTDTAEAARLELVHSIPQGRELLLLVCGAGGGADRAYLAFSPNTRCITASNGLPDTGSWGAIDEDRAGALFDAVALDDVLAGSIDVCATLKALFDRAAVGAVLTLSIRNGSHWSAMVARLAGDPIDDGRMTRASVIRHLQASGWRHLDSAPISSDPAMEAAPAGVLAEAARSLGISGEAARAELTAEAWVLRAVKGPGQTPVTIAALGLKKIAGVTEARIDHPMRALASQPFVRAAWGAGGVEIPGTWAPGVLILHRQFLDSPGFVNAIESRIAKGWVIVSEIDDDPHHWPQYVTSDFRAFRGVHAVTVTTEPLAQMIRQWNPHVEILPNAASYLPTTTEAVPKAGDRARVFFGALNREKDGGDVVRALSAAALELGDRVEFVVVHDRAFFDSLPGGIRKSFSPTLAFDAYTALLASCDIALLPLQDTAFNRLKSDLKFVECCAAGVVPICSDTVYGAEPRHRDIGLFAQTPAEWAEALRLLVETPGELARRRSIGESYVRQYRMHADQAAVREDLYRRLLGDRTALETDRQARLSKMLG